MFKAVDVFYAALTVFQGYCLQYFLGSFLETRIKSRWNGLCVVGVYAVLRSAVVWCSAPGYEDYRVAAGRLALSLDILSALAMCFYKAFRPVTVFLVVSFQALLDISSYVAVILVDKPGNRLPHLWNWCVREQIITSEKSLVLIVGIGTIVVLALQHLFIVFLLYFSIKKIVQNFHEKNYGINKTELLFILTPSAVGMMICMLLRIIMITVEDGIPTMLYERYPILVVVIPAILLLSLLSILYGVKLFQDMICWNREKSGRIVLENQISSLQEHMEEMERIYSGIRGMKHDMKNTLAVIQRLSAGDGSGALQEYLSELNKGLERLEVRFRTGNTVVDTLLNMKYHEAVRDVPDLKMNVDNLLFPQGIEIHSYDIGVILGNAVDNAIEACRKLKAKEPTADAFIRISSLQKGNLIILKVENSFDGRVVRKPQSEFPVTDKSDRKSHGIGLANIKSTAEKYQGAVDFKVSGSVFILSVMMKNERREEGIMAISGIGNNYNNMYSGTYATQKSDAVTKAKTKEAAPAQTGKAKDRQKDYDGMSNGNVSISSVYLNKCSEDSAKAKELEDFLRKIPELEKQGYEQLSAQNKALGGTVTYYQQTWMVNQDGSIQSTVYSVTETGMTNAERMKKRMDEHLDTQKEKKKEEKKAEENKAEENKAEENKAEKTKQAERLEGGTEKITMLEAAGKEITVKYVEAENELAAKAMMQKEKQKGVS